MVKTEEYPHERPIVLGDMFIRQFLFRLARSRLPSNSASTSTTTTCSDDEAKACQTEAEHLFAVKNWIPFLPTATLKLSARGPWAMVVMAY